MTTTATPAYKTTKFWATTVLTLVGLLLTSGVALPGVVTQVIGGLTTLLAALGFRKDPAQLPAGE